MVFSTRNLGDTWSAAARVSPPVRYERERRKPGNEVVMWMGGLVGEGMGVLLVPKVVHCGLYRHRFYRHTLTSTNRRSCLIRSKRVFDMDLILLVFLWQVMFWVFCTHRGWDSRLFRWLVGLWWLFLLDDLNKSQDVSCDVEQSVECTVLGNINNLVDTKLVGWWHWVKSYGLIGSGFHSSGFCVV